jgi:putative membrane protein
VAHVTIRLVISASALWVATQFVPGITYTGGWIPFLGVALVFGAVNAFVRPVAQVLTFPIVIVTLGLFLLVINGLMLWLTSALSDALGLGFHVEGFWPAFLGALVVSIVSSALSNMVKAERRVVVRSIQ